MKLTIASEITTLAFKSIRILCVPIFVYVLENIIANLCKILSSLEDDYLSQWSIQGGRQCLR